MKKFYYVVGALVTAAAIFGLIAVMLKKLRISLCIEGIDDELLDDVYEGDEVTLTFDDSDEDFLDEVEVETETETEETAE